MAKRSITSKKKQNSAKGQDEKRPDLNRPVSSEENENRFNFGGLPNRDLKKNLGCG